LAQSHCKEIKAEVEVFQAGQKTEKASVNIDFKGQSAFLFSITLFGPKGYSKDIVESEIKGLEPGSYTLVFVPKNESDNYCMKHLQFTIKKENE
jgi:hypothetical protein